MRIPAPTKFSLDEYRALHDGAGILERVDRGRIRLQGADRRAYLQGLLSNDILALQPGGWCYATLLTPQGRMISDMRVFELDALTLLDLPLAVTPAVREHLDRFVITEDVVVDDVSEPWAELGIYGPGAAGLLAALDRPRVAPPLHVLPGGDLGVPGFDLIVARPDLAATMDVLVAAGAVPVAEATVEVARVEAGIPKFLVDMDTSTIPLEAGIEDRAVSLTKGCYVGQEVIVRVLHRGGGRVARRLVKLAMGDEPVDPGNVIRAGDRDVGRVTSAVLSPQAGRWVALGYVQRDFTAPGTELEVLTASGAVAARVAHP